jgi:ATP-dependent Zn protease
MIREYLTAQFEVVLNLFKANHQLLKLVADRLNEKTFLTRKDFESIIQLQKEPHEQSVATVAKTI